MSRKSPKKRADLLLVDRGLAESREKARALIMEGLVYTPTGRVSKPGSPITADEPLHLKGGLPYVSRGGIKLSHALDRFGRDVSGVAALDVGSSTGGFTDCLLQRGARKVFALDVGHAQLDYRLRQDPRVVVMEGVNAHYPFPLPQQLSDTHHQIPSPLMGGGPGEGELPRSSSSLPSGEGEPTVGLATVDVSFISVTMVIPSVAEHVDVGGFMIVLVKPQFEARREEVGRGGVIKDPGIHARVLGRVISWVAKAGPSKSSGQALRLRDLTPSPILGHEGNREFFLLLEK